MRNPEQRKIDTLPAGSHLLARLVALRDAYRRRGDEAVAAVLDASVIRPLSPAGDASLSTVVIPDGELDERLWAACLELTRTLDQDAPPSALIEATAALQELACRAQTGDAAARREELQAAMRGATARVVVAHNGPLLALNVARVRTWLGEELPVTPATALCRCGASSRKPFCDGSHAANGFSDAKDPKRVPDVRDAYAGEQVAIFDNRGICQHSGFCTDRLQNVFRLKQEPFVAPSGGRMDEIVRAVRDCPSGALSVAIDGREARELVDWNGTREPSITVTKDGPYRIVGGVPLVHDDGTPVDRNTGSSVEHYALCRCGHSQNKPFCSGMHWYVEFADPAQSDRPTVFEWAGGLPALLRMTRLFYEKYVPNDPLLAPVFANMSPDHPERVAKWLAEVFCGPNYYSAEYGGYPRMLAQHMHKGLTEEMRTRWVELLLQAARDAQLPNDAEFASVFQAYIQWGSRLAVENSQTDSRPPQHMPMPHWGWETSAGPPGSRVSALATEQEEDIPPTIPPLDEPVRFDPHIKGLFRKRDRASMSFAFDLWAYDDVKKHATAILKRVREGSMPCDGAWPAERVACFERWVEAGMPA